MKISYQGALDILTTDQKNKPERIKLVKELLEEASNYYYNTDKLLLTDNEYDTLYNLYFQITGDYIIGALPKEGKGTINVEHTYENLVGTLTKCFTFEEAEKWIRNICDNYSFLLDYSVRVTLKYDGNSVTLEFNKNGEMIKALTRGKNGKGKDLTHAFKGYNCNLKLDTEFAIKYEAIVSYDNYNKICEKFDEDYANPRSLVSGLLGRDDVIKYKDYITLIPLKVKTKSLTNDVFYTELGELDSAIIRKAYGEDNPFLKYSLDIQASDSNEIIDKLKEFYDKIIKTRSELPFQIDGIVIEFLNTDIQESEGYLETQKGSIPRFATALKLPYLEKKTTVEGIDFSYGTFGRITPVVHFKPIDFNGTEHTKQSIHNYKRFTELNLGVGSEILVSYNSDCLSYVTKLETPNNDFIEPIEFIDCCPLCGSDLYLNENETFVTCSNPNCEGKVLGKLKNYFVKMDIKGIKESTLKKLIDGGLVNTIDDLYTMDYKKIAKIDGLGEIIAENLKKALINKKYYDYEILGSLGFEMISTETTKILCKEYSIKEILDFYDNETLFSKLIKVEGFSEILASYFIEGINENYNLIEYLMNRGYKCLKEEIAKNKSSDSLTIVFTGVRDKALQLKLEMQGHRVTSSVSNKTDIVVCADVSSLSVKAKTARELGKEIISIDEARKRWM